MNLIEVERMGIYALKPAFRRSLAPLARGLTPHVTPDAVSYAAVVLSLAAAALIALAPQSPWLFAAAAPLLVARLAANALDGMIAQAQSSATRRGEYVNELSDRASDALILGALALSGAAPLALAAGALVATLLVSYVGILQKAAGGSRNYAGPMGKADRMMLLAAALVVAPLWAPAIAWALGALVALALVTLANRARLAWRELGA